MQQKNHENHSGEGEAYQSIVNTTIADLVSNGGEIFGPEYDLQEIEVEGSLLAQSFYRYQDESGLVEIGHGGNRNKLEYSPEHAFLASLSKIAVVQEYLDRFSSISSEQLAVSIETVKLLVNEFEDMRSSGVVLDNESARIFEEIRKKTEGEVVGSEIIITSGYLIHLSLVPSSNEANSILRDRVVESLGGEEKYWEYMRDKYLFDPTIGVAELRFLFDESPNVGNLERITESFHRLVSSNETFKRSMSHCTEVDSGYNFAGTQYAQELLADGYKVYEKYGDFPYVFYVRSLARKFPPFMTFLSLVSIEDKDGNINTFLAYNMIKVPIPNIMTTVEARGYEISVPDEGTEEYAQFIERVSNLHRGKFRSYVEDNIKRYFEETDAEDN